LNTNYSLIATCVGCVSTTFVHAVEESKCYQVNNRTYCFYGGKSELLGWNEAREFCARRNSTLPIVTNEDVDKVFQQFIELNDSYRLVENRSVWIAAHARSVNNSVSWHWINGQPSSRHNTHYGSLQVFIFELG